MLQGFGFIQNRRIEGVWGLNLLPPCAPWLPLRSSVSPALAEKSGAIAVSRDCSRCLVRCQGEISYGVGCQRPRGWQLSSKLESKSGVRGAGARTRVRAIEGLETEELEVDLDVERMRPLRPVVERFNIQHEKNVSEERLQELGVSRWSKWDCGPGVTMFWEWKVDELVYVSKGSVEVVPDGCSDAAVFYAGDLVRFPKWFEASLTFDEDYEQSYKFFAYGD